MFLHNLRVAWNTLGRPHKIIGKSRIQNYKMHNVLVLSDEMARKQKKLNQQEKKMIQNTTKRFGMP